MFDFSGDINFLKSCVKKNEEKCEKWECGRQVSFGVCNAAFL